VTIFGFPWEELKLEHVEKFLVEAGREPLTWEAKGTELRSEHVTRHVCGFANAADGGYLLLGFELIEGEWRPTGCDFRGDDLPAWVSNVPHDPAASPADRRRGLGGGREARGGRAGRPGRRAALRDERRPAV